MQLIQIKDAETMNSLVRAHINQQRAVANLQDAVIGFLLQRKSRHLDRRIEDQIKEALKINGHHVYVNLHKEESWRQNDPRTKFELKITGRHSTPTAVVADNLGRATLFQSYTDDDVRVMWDHCGHPAYRRAMADRLEAWLNEDPARLAKLREQYIAAIRAVNDVVRSLPSSWGAEKDGTPVDKSPISSPIYPLSTLFDTVTAYVGEKSPRESL